VRDVLDELDDGRADDSAGPRRWVFACLGLLLRRPHDTLAAAAAITALATILVNAMFLQPDPHPAPLFSLKGKQTRAAARDSTGAIVLPRPRPAEMPVRPEPAIRPESLARGEPAVRPEPAVRAEPAPRAAPVRPRSEIVSDIQRELARRGFYDGPVNGKHGGKTEAAIREFEKSAGLSPTGEPNEAILKTITRTPVGKPAPSAAVISPRAEPSVPPARAVPSAAVSDPIGAALRAEPSATPPRTEPSANVPSKQVKAVQQALADFGYGQVKPTGVPDAATRAAIEAFETVHKLPVTGEISDRFLRELAAVTDRPVE
jgi:peptidoglycan hydrolase-like protein with peptidoglycan-binding domain